MAENPLRPSPIARWLIVLMAILASACVGGALLWGMMQLLGGRS